MPCDNLKFGIGDKMALKYFIVTVPFLSSCLEGPKIYTREIGHWNGDKEGACFFLDLLCHL